MSHPDEHARLRELHEEEERMKLRILQADAGLIGGKELIVAAERMDWMYHNPAQAKKETENEEYLFGKPLTTTDEREEMKKRLGVGTTMSGALFMPSVTVQNEDTLRRLKEDPLFAIRQAEHRQHNMELARQRILGTRDSRRQGKRALSPGKISRPFSRSRSPKDRQRPSIVDEQGAPRSRCKNTYSIEPNTPRPANNVGPAKNVRPAKNVFERDDQNLHSSRRLVKGPILPREWKSNMKDLNHKELGTAKPNQRDTDAYNSDTSTSSDDLGPPKLMASKIDRRRQEKASIPTLTPGKSTVSASNGYNKKTLDKGILKRTSEPNENLDKDVFAQCKKTLMLDQDRKLRVEQMLTDGLRHEEAKCRKINHLEAIEKLRDHRENEKRAETGSTFVKEVNRSAYLGDKQTLEERMKRYAARRKTRVLEDEV